MRRVDGKTQIYAVLGHPVHHSRSPEIQNAAFAAAGRNAVYVALEVPAPRLDQALAGLHAARVMGLNLTTPHKEAAFHLKSVISRTRQAEWAGAVNTLAWEPTGWRAHATDGVGFLAWVAKRRVDIRGKKVLVLGAGGAARAILGSLFTLAPASIHIVSRTAAHAESVAKRFETSGQVASAPMDQAPAANGWQAIIRALSVEAVSKEEEAWWRAHGRDAAMFDLNYGERSSDARALARELGLAYESGEELLIQQGAASFEFWTGEKPSVQAMREALEGAE